MANDRLFLQCRACGSEIMLAKYRPGSGWCFNLNMEALPDWVRDHTGDGHMIEHDAFDRAAERPFALYQEDEAPIPMWRKDDPSPLTPTE